MIGIPLSAIPSQTVYVTLGGQPVKLKIYTLATGLFMDVSVNGTVICSGVICLNSNKIVRESYSSFIGDFSFFDQQGTDDPTYDGLGARYRLVYLEASDL